MESEPLLVFFSPCVLIQIIRVVLIFLYIASGRLHSENLLVAKQLGWTSLHQAALVRLFSTQKDPADQTQECIEFKMCQGNSITRLSLYPFNLRWVH